jgi:radical SAM protein with 4Fe4S-binding SPASM domain
VSDRLARLPVLLLAPHSQCNCRCVMCDIWRAPGREGLSAAEVARLVPDIRRLGVERVVLTGGEALMHADLWALCRHLREAGVAITLLSTGVTLARDAGDVARFCDEVILSVDGPPPIHDAIRRVRGAFDRLADGVAALRSTGARVRIGGRCTVQHANVPAIGDTVAAAHGLQLDDLSFLAVDVASTAFNRPAGWTADRQAAVVVSAADLDVLDRQLTDLERDRAADFASGFIVESPEKLRRRLLWHFQAVHGLRPFPARRCNAPWVSSVVEADGTVRPCFFHRAIGSLRDGTSLDAVLNGDEARAFRRALDVATDPTCERCVCTLYREAAS